MNSVGEISQNSKNCPGDWRRRKMFNDIVLQTWKIERSKMYKISVINFIMKAMKIWKV